MKRTISNFAGVSVFIFLSKVLGFLRDILIAATIGTSKLADIYLQIFGIPGLFFTGIGNAISAVNIPTLTYYIEKKTPEEKQIYIKRFFALVVSASTLVCILGIIFAPLITKIILPGMDMGAAKIAIVLTRIMMPTLIFINLAYMFSGVLHVHGYFILPAVISIPFNLIIIISLFIYRKNIVLLGVITTVGWLLQFAILVPVFFKEKYRMSLKCSFNKKYIEVIYKTILPILLGNAGLQVCFIIDKAFASRLSEGSTSALSYGSNLFITITGVFIIAMSTVIFPNLSKYCIKNEFSNVKETINYGIKILFFIFMPYIIEIVFYNKDIISLIYKRGEFNQYSVDMTAKSFMLYSFCVFGYMAQEIFNRVFYAMKKYTAPMVISSLTILLNILFNVLFIKKWGVVGIAGGTVICFALYAVLMVIAIKQELGSFLNNEVIVYVIKVLKSSICMILVIGICKFFGFSGLLQGFIIPTILGMGVYIFFAWKMNILDDIYNYIC